MAGKINQNFEILKFYGLPFSEEEYIALYAFKWVANAFASRFNQNEGLLSPAGYVLLRWKLSGKPPSNGFTN